MPIMSWVPFVVVTCSLQAQPELIERTLAIVGGQVITLADVRTVLTLGLVDGADGPEQVEGATNRLFDRALILRELQHYSPPEPAEHDIQSRIDLARQRLSSSEAFQRTLVAGGFSEERLRAWIRDDLRIVAYLEQRFAAAGIPNDQEVAAYYAEHREEFERGGVPLDEATPLIRERLAMERRRELITDWLSDLRRRTEIVRIGSGSQGAGSKRDWRGVSGRT
jgi:hypothetical protein